jgi:cytochrome c-type biogenesis protein CcmH/NrfF
MENLWAFPLALAITVACYFWVQLQKKKQELFNLKHKNSDGTWKKGDQSNG